MAPNCKRPAILLWGFAAFGSWAGPSTVLADPKHTATTQTEPTCFNVDEVRPAAMYRASRLLDNSTVQRTYDLCAGERRNVAFFNSVVLLRELTDLVGALELSFDADALRLRALASRALARLPPANETLPGVQEIAATATDAIGKLSRPDFVAAPSAGQFAETVTRDLRAALPRIETLVRAVPLTSTCDEGCVDAVIADCREDAQPPAEVRTPPSGGIAFSPRTNSAAPSTLHASDPAQIEWMWEKFGEMCKAPEGLLPKACAISGMDHGETRMFPGVLLAAALRSDLERLPAHMGECGSNALLQMLKRIRSGTPPLSALAGLRSALSGESAASAVRLREASELISLFGDVLAVADQLELERALANIVKNVDRYTRQCASRSQDANAPPCPAARTPEQLSELGREVFTLNQLSTRSSSNSGESSEDGYQLMLATIRTLSSAMGPATKPSSGTNTTSWYISLCATARMLAGKYADGVLYLDALRAHPQLSKVLPLIVSLAAEQTPTGVSAAIDSVAPVVTSVDLKTQRPQLNLAGVLGPAATYDVPISALRGVKPVFVGGLTASLGFALTVPTLFSDSYFHLYVSVVDVGQVVSTPLFAPDSPRDSGTTHRTVRPAPTTDLRLSQLLAPGLFIGYSWPHTVLVASCGVSTAPSLREYEIRDELEKKLSTEQYSVYRFGCRFVIDASVVRFF